MVEISTSSMKRTGPPQAAGACSSTHASRSGRRRNRPGSAGTSLSLISASQAGWVKSPVPTTVMPFLRAHNARWSMSAFLDVAREYFE